ncbi:MAG: tripartite tricarboxylate transporter TctB family protein [Betaproteobacteria bacterium]
MRTDKPISSRWPELAVAALLVAIALLVIADSLRVGIGWASDGPRSGYFPFYIGLLLLASAGSVLVRTLLHWNERRRPFADRSQLASVLAVLGPMAVYVAGVSWLGLYLPSALLIGWFMRRHGGFGWLVSVGVSVAVPVVFFLVFERWFLVPLPKGPIERLLGF